MTKATSAIGARKFIWPLLGFTALIVYFAGLDMPLVGPDEPRYAQVAREMFERGDWVTPTLGGFNWFEKPALLYWLQIASYNLFGVTEFAARFGSALFGLGTVASLWILGRYHAPTDGDQRSNTDFAKWLAMIAASTVGIVAFAHGASFDIILTFPITAAMVGFYLYDVHRRPLPLILFYFFIGAAVLAKGLVGLVFPFASVGLYHLVLRRWPSRTLLMSLVWGTLLSIAVASLWYLPMYIRHGYEFIDQFFIQHHFQRYTSNKYFHPQPFYFFFWVLPLMTIPWMPFFIAALWRLARQAVGRSERTGEDVDKKLQVFALCWLVVPMVFFSFSGSKLPGYILPAAPAAMILTAAYLFYLIRTRRWAAPLVIALSGGTFAVILIVVFAVAPRFVETDSMKSLFATASSRGLIDSPVMMLHTISHNAEFYAPGRILRDPDGRQKRFPAPKEVSEALSNFGGKPGLVIVPLEYLEQLLESQYLRAELLKDNGEQALVAVYPK